jgi:lipoprotein NlpD
MRRLFPVLMFLVLVACAGQSARAPVENRSGEDKIEHSQSSRQPSNYRVVRGDTLYAIAWRYGMDYRKLASANGITPPYHIYPGEDLQLGEKDVETSVADASAVGEPLAPPATGPTVVPATSSAPATRPTTAIKRVPTPAGAEPNTDMSVPNKPVTRWLWPATGKVVRDFSGTVHKGIDIGGAAGDPVLATSSGRVVYAGNGIVGYGNLLIVKHNELYLSAYGHNRQLLVKQGDMVKSGERIAEKGSSATNSVRLHFEIRREGKPINPIKLLPAS